MMSKAEASEIRKLGADKGIQWMINDAERKKRRWEYAAENPRGPFRLHSRSPGRADKVESRTRLEDDDPRVRP